MRELRRPVAHDRSLGGEHLVALPTATPAIRFKPDACNQIPLFGGEAGEDVEAWLQEFNFITRGWSTEQKVVALRIRMKDKARAWLQSLTPSIGFDFEPLERNLKQTFGRVHEHDEPYVQLSRR